MSTRYSINRTKLPSIEDKEKLADIIVRLKKSNIFYKHRLRLIAIEHYAKIPMGTLGWQLKYKKISDGNYLPLLEYLERLQKEFNKLQTKKKGNIYQL